MVVLGKGGKQRIVYLTRLACKAIQDYVTERADTYQPLFISHGRNYGARLTKVSIWQAVKPLPALTGSTSPPRLPATSAPVRC